MKSIQIAGLVVASIAASAAAADNVFKSVDDNGIVAFSDRPLNGEAIDTVELDVSRTNARNMAEQKKSDQYMANAVALREEEEAADAAEQAQMQKTVAEQRASNCELAKNRSESYNTHRRLYKATDDGEREYLSDEELDTARADAARAVDEWCN